MNDMNQLLNSLSPEKRALLEKRLLRKNTPAPHERLATQLRKEPRPLSFGQESLWFFDQFEPDSAVYNISQAVRLRGKINPKILGDSFETIISRHESLRTNFISINDNPAQVVKETWMFTLPVVDLSGFSEPEREATRWLEHECRRTFNLAEDLLLRAALLRVREDEHILFVCLHHIASDAWSIALLNEELTSLYKSFSIGEPSALPELYFQYSDYAICQRERFRGEFAAKQIDYWKARLAGDLPILDLRSDRARPAEQTFRGAVRFFEFHPPLLAAVKELSRRENVTVYSTLLAAFQILLQRYSAQDDILVGSPVGARYRTDTEKLIGYFINTVVLRSDLSSNPTFQELLQQVHNNVLGALTNQDVPLERLVEELKVPRRAGYNPLVQVLFQYLATPIVLPQFQDVLVETIPLFTPTAKFDLTLTLRGGSGHLLGEIEFNTDVFDVATIDRLFTHYQTLLEEIVANPERKITSLPLLNITERHQLWNDVEVSNPKFDFLHVLFENQAARVSDQAAVCCGHDAWSYAELNQRANQLAHRLRKMGVGPETLVCLCMERSVEMILGILAILKAGGAYVPLDPGYPKERLADMLEEAQSPTDDIDAGTNLLPFPTGHARGAGQLTKIALAQSFGGENGEDCLSPSEPLRCAPIVLTCKNLLGKIPAHRGRNLCIDADWPTIACESQENCQSNVTPENLAYVIFTSGSTGKPKGVLVTHANLFHSTNARLAYYREPVENFLLLSSFSFDSSVAGIFWTLASGGTLTLPQEGLHQDPGELVRLIQANRVSHFLSLPSVYNLILEIARPQELASLKVVIVAGESCRRELVERHHKIFKGNEGAARNESRATLYNEYGPTEGSVWCTVELCDSDQSKKITIGKPIPNTQVYILDAQRGPSPVGVPGEIHVGGAGVVRGYLNQPGLTAEKFIPNPFAPLSSRSNRLYKTGDLACYLSNGKIDFIGRIDQQVKIRGHRIELEEIEGALKQISGVRDAVVTVIEDSSNGKTLAGYLAVPTGSAPARLELRNQLKSKLPDYMIPTAFVFLETLPQTPNGKVDRQALPAPEFTAAADTFVEPRTMVEMELARIWSEVLGVKRIGIHDNFFELGGHSLLAAQVISRMRKVVPSKIDMRDFFQSPTIAGISAIAGKNVQKIRTGLPKLVALSRKQATTLAASSVHVLDFSQSSLLPPGL